MCRASDCRSTAEPASHADNPHPDQGSKYPGFRLPCGCVNMPMLTCQRRLRQRCAGYVHVYQTPRYCRRSSLSHETTSISRTVFVVAHRCGSRSRRDIVRSYARGSVRCLRRILASLCLTTTRGGDHSIRFAATSGIIRFSSLPVFALEPERSRS